MRVRKQEIGEKNIIGQKVENRRKELGIKQKDLLAALKAEGVDMNSSGLSKLEGQLRCVTDYEVKALAKVLGVSVMFLLGIEDK